MLVSCSDLTLGLQSFSPGSCCCHKNQIKSFLNRVVFRNRTWPFQLSDFFPASKHNHLQTYLELLKYFKDKLLTDFFC